MIRLERRPEPSRAWTAATPVLAVIATMIAGGIMFAALGKDPVAAIRLIFWDPLFNEQFAAFSRPQLLVKAGPLILIAIGLSLGFRAGIWNIGAEGQLYIGALAATIAGVFLPVSSPFVAIPVLVLASFLGGGLWAAFSGWLKSRFGVSEIITTIMMNYIAIFLVSYAVHHPLRDPQGYLPQSPPLRASAELPVLLAKTRLHFGG